MVCLRDQRDGLCVALLNYYLFILCYRHYKCIRLLPVHPSMKIMYSIGHLLFYDNFYVSLFTGENTVMYLFVRLQFNWDELDFSIFSTYCVIVNLIGEI